MSILSGSLISASNLNSAGSGTYQQLLQDNQRVPSVTWFNLYFDNLIDTTTLAKRTKNIVIPDDYLLAEVAVCSGLMAGNVTVSIDNNAMIEPISITKANLSGVEQRKSRSLLPCISKSSASAIIERFNFNCHCINNRHKYSRTFTGVSRIG